MASPHERTPVTGGDSEAACRVVVYVVSNALAKVSSLLPSNKNRSLLVHSLVKAYGLLLPWWSSTSRCRVIPPEPADYSALSMYHARDYLDFILDPSAGAAKEEHDDKYAQYGIEEDCPTFQGLPEYVRLVAGGTLTAARILAERQADIAICWDGGRHHAQKSRASGFCYVADCVLAVLALKRVRIPSPLAGTPPSRRARVMYLDLDLHFSDGVSQAFLSSNPITGPAQVLTMSIHHAAPGFFPASDLAALSDPSSADFDPFTLSLPLAKGASNRTFARVWRSAVESIKTAFDPDFVVLQCGADGLAGDPYAVWNWSLGGEDGSFGWCIDQVCNIWGRRTLLLGGGGYNSPNVARAWAYLTSVALGRPLDLDSDIPDHSAFPLYSPSFILDVPAGNIQDQNTEEYLHLVQERFTTISHIIQKNVRAGSM